MCGIVGYAGSQEAAPLILDALKRLEYRGYDSAGLAIAGTASKIFIRRAAGKLRNLEMKMRNGGFHGHYGIGHTRWATHGRPTGKNAHPHRDCRGTLAVVHNGVIDNYLPLRRELIANGHRFRTDTDTETIAHLIEDYAGHGHSLEAAVRMAANRLRGAFTFAALSQEEPRTMVVVRHGPPILVGLRGQEYFVASDVSAILPFTRDVLFLENDDVAVFSGGEMKLLDLAGTRHTRTRKRIGWSSSMVEKGDYQHFMLKEIYEQPVALQNTLRRCGVRADGDTPTVDIGFTQDELARFSHIRLIGCGTSWHAALVGKFMLEQLARVRTEVDYGSEFRYRDPLVSDDTLTIAISQSGETADTLGALREARTKRSKTLAICNVAEATLTREADATLFTAAGPEIGVASTKTFTTQLLTLLVLAVHLGRSNGALPDSEVGKIATSLSSLNEKVIRTLELHAACRELAKLFSTASSYLYLGRGIHYPIALEGALKLKEVSYLHADGYPAGEMKHGPNALIEEGAPVIVLCPRDLSSPRAIAWYEKTLGNIREVQARGAHVVAVCSSGDTGMADFTDHVLELPTADELIQPMLEAIPLQLLAYEIALRRGCDIDKPRNLAKSVTVE